MILRTPTQLAFWLQPFRPCFAQDFVKEENLAYWKEYYPHFILAPTPSECGNMA